MSRSGAPSSPKSCRWQKIVRRQLRPTGEKSTSSQRKLAVFGQKVFRRWTPFVTFVPTIMILLETSVWVSSIVPADSNHQRARRWLEAAVFAGEILVGPSLLAIEVAGAVARRSRSAAAGRGAVERLLRL